MFRNPGALDRINVNMKIAWQLRDPAALFSRFLVGIAITSGVGGCANVDERAASTPCAIAVPDRTLINKDAVLSVRGELTTFVAAKASIATSAEVKGRFEQTYQTLKDNDVSCALLLRTVACLAERGRSESEVIGFREYLRSTHSCESTNQAKLSVDSVVQTTVDDAYRFENPPISVDIFVRNSGDQPAQISTVTAWFDEHLRPDRAPSDMQRLSAVYAVTIDSTGANVKGAEANLNSPANAWYPNPGSPVLIVDTPVAQALGPRSTDRFRITYTFLDNMMNRGPREQVRLEVNYNNGMSTGSKPIRLAKQDSCLRFQVKTPEGMRDKFLCKDGNNAKEGPK